MSRTVLITGASEGIGLEVARQAVAQGDSVLMVAWGETKLRAAAAALGREASRLQLSTLPTLPLDGSRSIGRAATCPMCW